VDIGGPWWIGKGVDTGTRAGIGGPWWIGKGVDIGAEEDGPG
jgi:serine acetyltransferase